MLYADDLCIVSLSSAGLQKLLSICDEHCANQLDFVQEDKYLGVLLNPSMKTSIEISRQTRKFYAQANMLLHSFRYCSNKVKCSLLKLFCTNMYCYPLWINSAYSS